MAPLVPFTYLSSPKAAWDYVRSIFRDRHWQALQDKGKELKEQVKSLTANFEQVPLTRDLLVCVFFFVKTHVIIYGRMFMFSSGILSVLRPKTCPITRSTSPYEIRFSPIDCSSSARSIGLFRSFQRPLDRQKPWNLYIFCLKSTKMRKIVPGSEWVIYLTSKTLFWFPDEWSIRIKKIRCPRIDFAIEHQTGENLVSNGCLHLVIRKRGKYDKLNVISV